MANDRASGDEQRFREFQIRSNDDQRAQARNPPGREPADEIYREELAPTTPDAIRQAQLSGERASDDKTVIDTLP